MEGRPLADEALIERAQAGDERAYEQIVETYQGLAFRVAYLVTGSAADAEEAVQDGFLKAWRALARFRRGEPLRPWLLRIVANEARNRRRSASRRAALSLRAADEPAPGEAAPSPEAAAVDSEARAHLLAAVDALPQEARLVIALRYFVGLSEAETAAALGIRRGTVKSRTARALDRLRVEL